MRTIKIDSTVFFRSARRAGPDFEKLKSREFQGACRSALVKLERGNIRPSPEEDALASMARSQLIAVD
jgi:hypothetical protein